MSAICARLSKGKGVIHKRVENRRLSTLLCPRRVGGPSGTISRQETGYIRRKHYDSQNYRIDKEKCNGCGLCAHACHEGAIGMVDGKATLLRDDYCDGLGNCLPVCPTGAISFVEREAAAYDEAAVQANMQAKISAAYRCPGSRRGALNTPRSISRPRSFRCRASCASGRCRSSSCR